MKKQLKIERWIYLFLPLTIFIFLLSNLFLMLMSFEVMLFKSIKETTVIKGLINGTANFSVLRIFLIASLISMFHIMYCAFLSWYNLRTHIVEQAKLQHLNIFVNRYIKAKQAYENAMLDKIVIEIKKKDEGIETPEFPPDRIIKHNG